MAKHKCTLCDEEIKTTFLDKLDGTFINKKPVCSACQKEHKDKLKDKISE
ncbi:hypothetical protein HOA55_05350 [archaeon]|jgi:hypothetical protein|nr:hypothetical protein [archaeon]MBT3577748.1 hypothetical protein [archaeon]MBT6820755.1 hypothetical protein [archaeon]MBT6956432.1 hypothetical protein [archaeon]MBT7025895.1 hypothetical protein [archaeon]